MEAMLGGRYVGWRYKELARVLQHMGYAEVSRKGSHRTWKHQNDPKLMTIPEHGRPLPAGYIRNAVRRITALRKEE